MCIRAPAAATCSSSGNNVFTGSNYDTGSHTFHLPILGSSDGQTNAAGSKVAGLNDVTAATNNTVKAAGSVILGGTNINIGNPTFHGPLVLGDGADLTPISSGSSIPVFGLEPSTYKVRVFQGIGVNEPSGDLFIPGILSANYGGSIKGLILGTNADGTTMQQAATNAAAAATNNFPASSIASGGTLPALNGSALTSLTGGNVSGTVSAATTATRPMPSPWPSPTSGRRMPPMPRRQSRTTSGPGRLPPGEPCRR